MRQRFTASDGAAAASAGSDGRGPAGEACGSQRTSAAAERNGKARAKLVSLVAAEREVEVRWVSLVAGCKVEVDGRRASGIAETGWRVQGGVAREIAPEFMHAMLSSNVMREQCKTMRRS